MRACVPCAQARERAEPEQHDRPEAPVDRAGSVSLNREQADQQRASDRYDCRPERRGGDFESLDRAQHGDRGRDHALSAEQRSAEQGQKGNAPDAYAVRRPRPLRHQRQQGEDPSFPPVVSPHDEHQVLERHDEHQRPEDQRQHAQQITPILDEAVLGAHAFLQRVEGARADVSEHHAKRRDRERHHAALRFSMCSAHERSG
jgi:hypothetical protein